MGIGGVFFFLPHYSCPRFLMLHHFRPRLASTDDILPPPQNVPTLDIHTAKVSTFTIKTKTITAAAAR